MMKLVLALAALAQLALGGEIDRAWLHDSLARVHPRLRSRWLSERDFSLPGYFESKVPESYGIQMTGKWGRGPSYEVTGRDSLVFLSLGSEVAIINFTDPDNPEVLSEPQAMGLVTQAAVRDSFLYVGTFTGAAGIEIWNIADLRSPAFRNRILTRLNDFCIRDSFAFVTQRSSPSNDTFKVYNLADPDNPRLVGACRDSGQAITVAGNTVILGDWNDLHALDVSDPANPRRVGQYPGWSVSVAARDSLCYATIDNPSQPGTQKLVVLDLSDPSQPYQVGLLEGAGGLDLYLADSLVFVSGYNAGVGYFQVLSVADPQLPRLVGQAPTLGDNWGAYADLLRHVALVADGPEGLQVFDISNPASPVDQATLLPAGSSLDVSPNGAAAAVANDWAGVKLLDIGAPSEPVELSAFDTTYQDPLCAAAALSDSFLFAGWSRWPYFRSLDATSPESLSMAGGCAAVQGWPQDITLRDTFAYIAGMRRFQIVNVSRPREPVLVGSCVLPDESGGMALCDTLAFVTNAPVKIIDIRDPVAPVVVGEVNRGAWNVFVQDTFAYLAGGNGLFTYSVADVHAPYLIDSTAWGADVFDVVVVDTLAYVGCRDGLRLLSVADPSSPRLLGYCATPYLVWRLTYAQPYVYAACAEAGVVVLETTQTGIAEPAVEPSALSRTVQLVPNPTRGLTRIVFGAGTSDATRVSVVDVAGRDVTPRKAVSHHAGEVVIDAEALGRGVYYVRVQSPGRSQFVKLVKN
jgi:hypothetical protein